MHISLYELLIACRHMKTVFRYEDETSPKVKLQLYNLYCTHPFVLRTLNKHLKLLVDVNKLYLWGVRDIYVSWEKDQREVLMEFIPKWTTLWVKERWRYTDRHTLTDNVDSDPKHIPGSKYCQCGASKDLPVDCASLRWTFAPFTTVSQVSML